MAYYPPYHGKYDRVERRWGVLECYWSDELLDSTETVLRIARNVSYPQKHLTVIHATEIYTKGVRRTKAETDAHLPLHVASRSHVYKPEYRDLV